MKTSALLPIVAVAVAAAAGGVRADTCPGYTVALTCDGHSGCDLVESATGACRVDCVSETSEAEVKPYYADTYAASNAAVRYPSGMTDFIVHAELGVAQGYHLRVVGEGHTANEAIDGEYVLSTTRINAIEGLGTHGGVEVVTVQAGALFWDILVWLDGQGRSIGAPGTMPPVPGYGDITVGGFAAVGGHGSSSGAADFASAIVAIEKLSQNGTTTWIDASTPALFRAARADMGLLGPTTRIKIAVQPEFNVRQRILTVDKTALEQPGGFVAAIAGCDWVFGTYWNSNDSMNITCGSRTTDPLSGDDGQGAQLDLFKPDFYLFESLFGMIAGQGLQWGACDAIGIPQLLTYESMEQLFLANRKPWITYRQGGVQVNATSGVGKAYRMIQANFRDGSIPRLSQEDFEIGIPESQFDAYWNYVMSYSELYGIFNPLIGTVVRTGRCNTDTYLAQDAAVGGRCTPGERVFYVEFPTFHPFDFSEAQYAAHRAPYVEMILYGVMNHRGLVHLGKNGSIVHLDPAVLAATAPARAGLQPQIDARDPYGVYRTGYFAALGYSWPQSGGNFVAAYYPGWNGKARRLRNLHTGKCAQVIRADGYDDETRDCSGSFLQGEYFFASPTIATGTTLATPVSPAGGTWYTVRSRGNIDRCLRAGWDFAACDGSDGQRHRLNARTNGWQLESKSPSATCARDDYFSDEIINWVCSDFLELEPNRKRWALDVQ